MINFGRLGTVIVPHDVFNALFIQNREVAGVRNQVALKWKLLDGPCDAGSRVILLRQDPWEDAWCLERV